MSTPTAKTIGLQCGSLTVNLHGVAYGAAAEHNPAYTPDVIPMIFGVGVGVKPLSQPGHIYAEERIEAALDGVSLAEFAAYKLIVAQATKGTTVSYSPMGQTTYTSSGWTLISTTDGWVETSHRRWSGVIALAKRGSTF